MVNRIWHYLFDEGIVRTVDNFGQTGERPSHPELLDYLAGEFINDGWSTKSLIRQIVLSRTYQLSNGFDEANFEVDPDNRLLWRMNRRRLDFEEIRDALLFVSGKLERQPPEASPLADVARGELGRRGNTNFRLAQYSFRSVYLPIIRSKLPAAMSIFDFPDSSEVRGRRDVTTVPTQALFMMNSPIVMQNARLAAQGLLASDHESQRSRITLAYQQTVGRAPTESEIARTQAFLKSQPEPVKVRKGRQAGRRFEAWTQLYHALLPAPSFVIANNFKSRVRTQDRQMKIKPSPLSMIRPFIPSRRK